MDKTTSAMVLVLATLSLSVFAYADGAAAPVASCLEDTDCATKSPQTFEQRCAVARGQVRTDNTCVTGSPLFAEEGKVCCSIRSCNRLINITSGQALSLSEGQTIQCIAANGCMGTQSCIAGALGNCTTTLTVCEEGCRESCNETNVTCPNGYVFDTASKVCVVVPQQISSEVIIGIVIIIGIIIIAIAAKITQRFGLR
jgi:hypothetical protein